MRPGPRNMTRGGKPKDRDAPERRCIATGTSGPKSGLIRFAISPDGTVTPDLAERLPGRGIWVSADARALQKAIDRNLFARAARKAVKVPPDLAEMVRQGLQKRLVELISVARKAGQAIAGLEKVKAALETGTATMLLQASDGSEREKSRLRSPDGQDAYFDGLSADQLGLAFGRDRVIHAALIGGGLGERVRYESARLSGMLEKSG